MGMADAEQLAILRKGSEVWNAWRTHNPDVEINLESADLNSLNLEWVNLADANLERADLSCTCMSHAILVRAKLQRANLAHASLDHANMAHAHLEKANLAFASLEEAMLPFAYLVETNFGAANLKDLRAEDANFRHANLSYSNLQNAVLACSDFRHANLMGANLEGANLTATNLESANVSLVKFDRNILFRILRETRCHPRALRKRWRDLVLSTSIRCKGIHAHATFGSQHFKLFLQDQDYLEELLETPSGRFKCYVWWLSSDCGRSLARWAGWSVLFALFYSGIYYYLGRSHFFVANMRYSYITALYYSIVTFTTLGFGDIAPTTNAAALIVCSEVILGYLMLGGLISIFAGKLSRRSG
jgi:uncharacterized protein YjbI with pentapeptide repeats